MRADEVINVGPHSEKMEDDEDQQREMNGEEGMKEVLESNEDEEVEHGWDRKRKPEQFTRDVDRRKKETRNHDGLKTDEGSVFAGKDRTKMDRHREGYGMLVLSNGKVMKLREKSLRKLGVMMDEGDNIRMGSAGGTLRLYRNTSNSVGIQTTSNAVPRQGNSGYRGSRGEESTPGVSFEGKVESLEGYPMNKGRRSHKRGARVASDLTASVTSRDHANGTNRTILVNKANSQMFEQWAGSLKTKSSATSKQVPVKKASNSPSSIRTPSVIGAAALKVGASLMKIKG